MSISLGYLQLRTERLAGALDMALEYGGVSRDTSSRVAELESSPMDLVLRQHLGEKIDIQHVSNLIAEVMFLEERIHAEVRETKNRQRLATAV